LEFFCVDFFFQKYSPFHPAKKNIQIQTDLTKNKTNFFYGTREKKLIIIIINNNNSNNDNKNEKYEGTFSHTKCNRTDRYLLTLLLKSD